MSDNKKEENKKREFPEVTRDNFVIKSLDLKHDKLIKKLDEK